MTSDEEKPTPLNYKGFEGLYEWDEERDEFFGEVVNIPKDVITFVGKTPEEAEREFRASVDDYLEFCRTGDQVTTNE